MTAGRALHLHAVDAAHDDGDRTLLTAFPTECHRAPSRELAPTVEGPISFFLRDRPRDRRQQQES